MPVQFNEYGTPVVPIRKAQTSNTMKLKLQICGDYSVGINNQLADHQYPMPLPEELMQKLGGGFGYTKIKLPDVYNQLRSSWLLKVNKDLHSALIKVYFYNKGYWLLSRNHGEPDLWSARNCYLLR